MSYSAVYDTIIDHRAGKRTPQHPRAFSIGEHHLFAPDGTMRDAAHLDAHLAGYGVDADFYDPLIADIEGERAANLYSPFASVRAAQLAEHERVLALIREVRPGALVGVYGIPDAAWQFQWSDALSVVTWMRQQSVLRGLYRVVDIICPVFYWRWLDGPSTATTRPMLDYEMMVQVVCGTIRARLDKPIHPFIMGTIHRNAPAEIAGQAFPQAQMACMTRVNVASSDGPLYWGRLADDTPEHNDRVLANFEIARGTAP